MENLLALLLQTVGGADPPSELEKAGNPLQYLVTVIDENPLLTGLLAFILVDIVSGVFAAVKEKKLSSQVSFVGMIQKAQILLYIFVFQLLQWLTLKTIHQDWPLAGAVMWFFIFRELISITENVKRSGINIPNGISDALDDLSAQAEKKLIKIIASPLTGEVVVTAPAPSQIVDSGANNHASESNQIGVILPTPQGEEEEKATGT